jgi:hypothetical protein
MGRQSTAAFAGELPSAHGISPSGLTDRPGFDKCPDPIPAVLAAIALSLADCSRTENALSTTRRNRTFAARTNTLVVPS